ncbi:MAG: hypothetical protein P8Y28_13865, partial [Gammaproteobacteria bacterium]
MRRIKSIFVIAIIVLISVACSKEEKEPQQQAPESLVATQPKPQSQALLPDVQPEAPTPVPSGYKVIDSFNVGQNVYVRSMTIDPVAKTLWVGTS